MFTDDGRILDVELETLRGCIDDPVTGMAFLIDPDNQMTDEHGEWKQILGERSTLPIRLIKAGTESEKSLFQIIKNIYHESHENSKISEYLKRGKDTLADKAMWIVVISCVTFMMAIAMKHFGWF